MKPYPLKLAILAGRYIETRDRAMQSARECKLADLRPGWVSLARDCNRGAITYLRAARREWQYMEHDIEGLRADLERAERELMRERA